LKAFLEKNDNFANLYDFLKRIIFFYKYDFSPITDYRLPITDYRLPITDYPLINTRL